MSVFWLWWEVVFGLTVSKKDSYSVSLIEREYTSKCVYFVRSNTLLLCICLLFIYLLYCTDPWEEDEGVPAMAPSFSNQGPLWTSERAGNLLWEALRWRSPPPWKGETQKLMDIQWHMGAHRSLGSTEMSWEAQPMWIPCHRKINQSCPCKRLQAACSGRWGQDWDANGCRRSQRSLALLKGRYVTVEDRAPKANHDTLV